MIPYWAKVRHEDVWTHHHPWYAADHSAGRWMDPSISRIVGKTVGELAEDLLDSLGWMSVVGGLMIVAGTLILIPGPVDVFMFTTGLYFGGPWGAVGAVVAYNLLGVLLLVGGTAMIYFD